MRIYVGNLSYEVTEDELRQAFGAHGQVTAVDIIKDKFSGQPKGFAFVEMADNEAAQRAIAELNGKNVDGREINVAEARPPREREQRDGWGGGGGGGGERRRRY